MKLKYYTWIGGFVIICIIVFFIYIVLRRLRSQTPLFKLPDAVFEEYKKIITPYNEDNTIETYVEYATGDTTSIPSESTLSKQISIKIKWANICCFDDIVALRFVRTVLQSGNDVVLEDTIIQRPADDTTDTEILNYFTNYTAENTYIFSVIPDGASALGTNTFKVFYYYVKDTRSKDPPTTTDRLLNKSQSLTMEISRSDLILSLSITESMEYNFLPSIRLNESASLTAIFSNEGYFLHPNNTREYSIQQKLQEPDKPIVITAASTVASGTKAVELKINNKDGTYTPLYIDSVGNLQKYVSGTLKDNVFNLIRTANGVYKIKRDQTDEFMIILNNVVTFRKLEQMQTEDVYKTINIYFYVKKNTEDKPCVSSSAVSTGCQESDSTILCNGQNLRRGEKCRTYRIDTPASGTGSCTVNINGQVTNLTDGMERAETCPVNCVYDTGTWSCPSCWKVDSDKTVPVTFTKLKDALNGGSCTAPAAKSHACTINKCNNCPTAYTTSGNCRTDSKTGKGQKYRTYYYTSTTNCIKAGLPSTGWYDDVPTCGSTEMCKWLPSTSCSGTTLNTTYVRSNSVTDCPSAPADKSEINAYACTYGKARCGDYDNIDNADAHTACDKLAHCKGSYIEGTTYCESRDNVPAVNVKCSDFGYTRASNGRCEGFKW